MLDLQFICENRDAVEANCRNRGVKVDLTSIVKLRDERNQLIAAGDELRHEQNSISGRIPKASPEERPALIARGKDLKEQIAVNETNHRELELALQQELALVPNMTHPDAPIGGEEAVVVLRESGTKPAFDFQPKDHVELMQSLDLLDLESGARVAGSGFYYLKNEAVLLELALVQFAIEKVRAAGFTLYTTPDLARDDVLAGIGFLPRGPEAQIYSIENSDLSLVETLPQKAAGISHCFRTEAGAHGKATRGIYRVHQFTKVEMFGFTAPDLAESESMHEQIVGIEEEIFQGLGIHYRVIDTPTGDLGGPAYRKFDLEAWMPARGDGGEYGEVTSASNCTDYQARRLGIRCRSRDAKGTRYVHTLNGTAIAVTRAMIALLENYQQADGSVMIPEVLRKWTGCERIGPPE
jgi:seryl-tRNA synthetase